MRLPKHLKKILTATIIIFSLLFTMSFAKAKDVVVIRVGEYEGKPGKRTERLTDWNKPLYPLTSLGELMEYNINKPIAIRIVNELQRINPDLEVVLQDTTSSKEDLNAAGRLALNKFGDRLRVYFSVHTNASEAKDANGYMFITGKNATWSDNKLADNLSEAMANNPYVRQRDNIYNTSYIGELNEVDNFNTIAVLGEFGFFTNDKDRDNLTEDEYIDYIARNVANEISSLLNKIDKNKK